MKDVESLEGEPRLGRQTLRPMPDSGWRSTETPLPAVPEPTAADVIEDRERRARVMQEFDISYDGRSYHYNGYCYEVLADAVGYAKLMRSQPAHKIPPPRS